MLFMNLWWLWLVLAVCLIVFAAWSARRHGEMVIENVAKTGSDESVDDLPLWRVKVAFAVGASFAIAFILSAIGWVLEYISRLIPTGIDLFTSLFSC